jgi:hypothetical protein
MTHRENKQSDTTDGKVGYKHPPVKSQFRKGQSGNPRGRRKDQQNLTPVLIEVLRQTVTVKQAGKAQRMSKGEALIQILLSKAHHGEGRANKAVLDLIEKIARIDTPELKLAGHGDYEFMLVPGVATSAEEWQWEIASRHETAAIRETVAAARAAGILLTTSQMDALRESVDAARAARAPLTTIQGDAFKESIGLARAAKASRTVTRRPVNRIVLSSCKARHGRPVQQRDHHSCASARRPGSSLARSKRRSDRYLSTGQSPITRFSTNDA